MQESCDVAERPHDAVVKFDTYRNLQWHRAVLPVIAWLLFYCNQFVCCQPIFSMRYSALYAIIVSVRLSHVVL